MYATTITLLLSSLFHYISSTLHFLSCSIPPLGKRQEELVKQLYALARYMYKCPVTITTPTNLATSTCISPYFLHHYHHYSDNDMTTLILTLSCEEKEKRAFRPPPVDYTSVTKKDYHRGEVLLHPCALIVTLQFNVQILIQLNHHQ